MTTKKTLAPAIEFIEMKPGATKSDMEEAAYRLTTPIYEQWLDLVPEDMQAEVEDALERMLDNALTFHYDDTIVFFPDSMVSTTDVAKWAYETRRLIVTEVDDDGLFGEMFWRPQS